MARSNSLKYIKNILFVLVLAPIFFTFYVSIFNLNKTSNLKILIWETQQQRIGLLLALGGALGFSLSSLNIFLASRESIPNRRKVITTIENKDISSEETLSYSEFDNKELDNDSQEYYFERGIREPSPTVSVPYKIISKPSDTFSNDKSSYQQADETVDQPPFSYSNNSNTDTDDSLTEGDWSINPNEDW